MAATFASPKVGAGLALYLAMCCGGWIIASAVDSHRETAVDPTRDYLPAKYFERMAREDMRRGNYAAAVNDYRQAAYWGNKVAQYDLGEIYLHGIGDIPADAARAVPGSASPPKRISPITTQRWSMHTKR